MQIEIPEGGFGVIITDDPWLYKNWKHAKNGSHRPHYQGMTYDQLVQIPVKDWAADDCILFQWGTWPKADQAVDLLRARGFDLVTGLPWVKTTADLSGIKRGVGFWSMGCSEFVLIGRRGKPKAERLKPNVLGLLCGSERAFYGPRARGGAHSNKPYTLHDYTEDKKIAGPYLELFAREPREGWSTWGHAMGQHVCEEGVISLEEAIRRGLVDAEASGVPVEHAAAAAVEVDEELDGF